MDFLQSSPGADPIVVEGYFAASPERVFRAWTEPDRVKKWFGHQPNSLASAAIDLRPGGRWRFLFTDDGTGQRGFEGEYIEIEPARRLVFSWSHVTVDAHGHREATPESRVDVQFVPTGSGTMVKLLHSGIRSEDARKGVGTGWTNAFASLVAASQLD